MKLGSTFAGSFYPEQSQVLKERVDDYLKAAPSPPRGRILGAVVPHAGYVYSGKTAGMALGAVPSGEVEKVVVMGPSHRVMVDGVNVFEVEEFETPLGPVAGDRDLSREIRQRLSLGTECPAFSEHSVEVQLPMVRRAFPSASVVEIVFGPPKAEIFERVGEALASLAREHRLLVVASSDLSHYYPRSQAQALDRRFRGLLEEGDPRALARALSSGETEACGAGPVLSLMTMTRKMGGRFTVVNQTDSSEASGDESQVVGYLSALAVLPSRSDG